MSYSFSNILPRFRQEDRLLVTCLIAIAIHAFVILCVTFSLEISVIRPPRLEITLAQNPSKAVENAEFIAQAHQEGSGDSSQKSRMTTDHIAPISDSQIREASLAPPTPQAAAPKPEDNNRVIVTTSKTINPFKNDLTPNKEKTEFEQIEQKIQYLERHLEISSLEAQLSRLQQEYSKLPRVYRMTSLSTRAEEDAAYLFGWQKRIERIGNLHYPRQALQQNITGNVRILVAIKADGSVHETRILQSSGHKILDNAALATIELAAPFQALPPAIRKKGDILEIIRTWRFSNTLNTEQ